MRTRIYLKVRIAKADMSVSINPCCDHEAVLVIPNHTIGMVILLSGCPIKGFFYAMKIGFNRK